MPSVLVFCCRWISADDSFSRKCIRLMMFKSLMWIIACLPTL